MTRLLAFMLVAFALGSMAASAQAQPRPGAPRADAPGQRGRAYGLREAGRSDYAHIKRLMAADQGRPFSDDDLSAVRYHLVDEDSDDAEDDKVEFHLFHEQGRPVGFISVHVDAVVTFRGYYFEPGKKDLVSLVLRMVELLDQFGKDGRITVCPPYTEILPVLEQELGDRMTQKKMTDAGDWVEVTVRHRPAR